VAARPEVRKVPSLSLGRDTLTNKFVPIPKDTAKCKYLQINTISLTVDDTNLKKNTNEKLYPLKY